MKPQRGFSLIEAVIAMVLVSVMLTAALRTVASARVSMASTAERARGAALAERLMTEILALPFEDPQSPGSIGPESGETGLGRALFDDVDDYHGLAESPPLDTSGVELLGVSGWRWSVQVQYVQPGTPGTVSGTATTMKRIRVTVESGRTRLSLDGYRTQAWIAPLAEGASKVSNTPPRAVLTLDASTPARGATVTFSGLASTDADSDTLSYERDLGAAGKATGGKVTGVYVSAGLQTVTLTVRDGRGGVSRAIRVLEVR